MYVKDLAYSVDQLCDFLRNMNGVQEVAQYVFSYDDVIIIIAPKPKTDETILKTPRAFMEIYGHEEECQKFYKTFLMQHITMGA